MSVSRRTAHVRNVRHEQAIGIEPRTTANRCPWTTASRSVNSLGFTGANRSALADDLRGSKTFTAPVNVVRSRMRHYGPMRSADRGNALACVLALDGPASRD